jgi:hypothetical protein
MANDGWDDCWEGMTVETTAESGGSVLICASVPPEVGGRPLLDPGRPTPEEGTPKLSWEGTPRKDCDWSG